MSVEPVNDSRGVRVQVVFHAWRTADQPSAKPAGETETEGPQAFGPTGEPAGLAGPAMVVLMAGLTAAVDSTRVVLTLTLAGMALIAIAALRATWRRRARGCRRFGGRHRVRGRNRDLVIIGQWCLNDVRP